MGEEEYSSWTREISFKPKKEEEKMPLQGMDRDTARLAELGGEGIFFEMDSRRVCLSVRVGKIWKARGSEYLDNENVQ